MSRYCSINIVINKSKQSKKGSQTIVVCSVPGQQRIQQATKEEKMLNNLGHHRLMHSCLVSKIGKEKI